MVNQFKQMEQEERELVFSSFSNETALQLGLALVAEAKQIEKAITVEIYFKGQRLFSHAMQGTTAENENWIRRKNNVVNHFGKSSWHVALRVKEEGTTLVERFNLPLTDYVEAGGGFPLRLKTEGVVGTITVSGLPDQEDHDLLVNVLRRFLN